MNPTDHLDDLWTTGLAEFAPDEGHDGYARMLARAQHRRRQRAQRRIGAAVAAVAVVVAIVIAVSTPGFKYGQHVHIENPPGNAPTTTVEHSVPSPTVPEAHTAVVNPAPRPVHARNASRPSGSVPSTTNTTAGPTRAGDPSFHGTGTGPGDGNGNGTGDGPGAGPPPPPPPAPPPPLVVTYTLDDTGLTASQPTAEAGTVTVHFVDARTDTSRAVGLLSDPQAVSLASGATQEFDLRVLRTYTMYAAQGSRRASNKVGLDIVEPKLASNEAADQLSVDITGGHIELPNREVRLGEPIEQFGHASETKHRWTEITTTTLTIHVHNRDHLRGTLQVDSGTLIYLTPDVDDVTAVLHLAQNSQSYDLRLQGRHRDMVILWRTEPH